MLKLLERLGRKAIMVNFYGQVMMERYHLFWYEEEEKGLPWPNVWLHHFPGPDTPDGVDPHKHHANVATLILKGGYVQLIDRVKYKSVKWFAFLSCKHNHRITKVMPNTWTLFWHGFRQQPWTFEVKECPGICKECMTLRNGQCINKENAIVTWQEQFARGDGYGWRAVKWIRVDENTEKLLARRSAALKKKGIVVPETRDEQRAAMREAVARSSNVA